MRIIHHTVQQIFFLVIRAYQMFISPLFGACCRFYPSCSQYAKEAISKKGVGLGILYSGRRWLKCQPFHPGGIDCVE